jgi:RNA polymerase sigma factor (sigma-70 family)
MDELSEEQLLIQQARSGVTRAQGRLVQRWYKRVYNYSLKYLGDHDQAMEVSQQTFIAMYQKLGGLRDTSKFKSWLYTLLVNFCRMQQRQNGKQGGNPLNGHVTAKQESEIVSIPSSAYDPEALMIQNELADAVQKALLQLSSEQREVLILKEYEGLKFREIAEALNISENTAKSRLYYALNHLRKYLMESSFSPQNQKRHEL